MPDNIFNETTVLPGRGWPHFVTAILDPAQGNAFPEPGPHIIANTIQVHNCYQQGYPSMIESGSRCTASATIKEVFRMVHVNPVIELHSISCSDCSMHWSSFNRFVVLPSFIRQPDSALFSSTHECRINPHIFSLLHVLSAPCTAAGRKRKNQRQPGQNPNHYHQDRKTLATM
jgi:hypothetical protein